MTTFFAVFGIGMAFGILLPFGIASRLVNRILRHRQMEAQAKGREIQRQTIESGRDTDPRRGDYVVTEGDLFGTLAGAMTAEHLQEPQRFSAKPLDLQPDWTTLSESGSDTDQSIE